MKFKTFAISLVSNEYRRQHILAQQEVAGLKINIFDAITPDTASKANIDYTASKALTFTGRHLMDTEIACALSHMTLWKQLLDDNECDYYLILEDDVSITDNIEVILENLDLTDVSFLKLSGQCKRPNKKICSDDDTYSLYRYAFGPLDAACYLINKHTAATLLNYCRDLKAPIDILMDRSYDHGVPIYGIMPYPVKTQFCFDENNPLYSDVGVRNSDYKKKRSLKVKILMRYHRLSGSFKRKLAAIRLRQL